MKKSQMFLSITSPKQTFYKPTNLEYIMSLVAVKAKIMPESPDVDLEKVKTQIEKVISEKSDAAVKFEEEPIAFGLKAIIVSFGWPEDQELEGIEDEFKDVDGVSSAEIIDMRRAFG